jgi:hypothetical protein
MSSTRARILADNIPVDAVTTKFFGNGSTTNFTINGSVGLLNPNNLIVALDGAIQEPGDDYTVNTNTISFSTPPDDGAKVVVVYRNAPFTTTSIVPTSNTVTNASIQLNAVTPEKLSIGAPVWNTSGNVALGHSSPTTNLHLNYSNYAAILMGANNSTGFLFTKETPSNTFNIWAAPAGSGPLRLRMNSSGDVSLGAIDPQHKLDVHGTIGFGLRSGGGNQPGYLSNIWSPTVGYRFFTLGSTYCDSSNNWITNPNASFGSNNVCTIVGDTGGGFRVYTRPATGNTQRTDSNTTFESYERFRVGLDGIVNTFNNPINNCPTTVKAYLNFSEATFAAAGGGAGPAIAPASTSIDQIVAGLDTGRWTFNSNWGPNSIGTIWYFNIAGNNQQYGGVDWTKGIQITSINGTFAFFKILGGPATVTPPNPIVGNGTTNGYTYQSFGIRNSFNIASITRQFAGRYRITFKTPMQNDWFVALVGAANSHVGDGSSTVIDYGITTNYGGKQAFSTKNYIDISSFDSSVAGVAIDTAWTYLAIFDKDYNPNY